MPNFFEDNDDLLFHFKHLDLDKIIEFRENNFAEADKYGYAPTDIKDAKDSYERILKITGQIAGDRHLHHPCRPGEECRWRSDRSRYARRR